MVVGDDVGLVGDDDEDGVSVVEYVRLKNVVAVGLDDKGGDDDGGDDGESVIYVVVGMPVVDDA